MYIKWKCRLISEYIVRLLLRSKFTDISPLLIFMLYSGVEFGMAEGVLGGHREKKCNACIYIYPFMFIIQEKHVYISWYFSYYYVSLYKNVFYFNSFCLQLVFKNKIYTFICQIFISHTSKKIIFVHLLIWNQCQILSRIVNVFINQESLFICSIPVSNQLWSQIYM